MKQNDLTTNTLDACLAGVQRHAQNTLRGILGMGLYMLKAHAVFARPADARGQGRKSSATVALDSNEGLDQWLTENITPLGISRRSAYNYMTAARVWLTADSTEEDLALLHLDGIKATDLYKLNAPAIPQLKPPISDAEKATQLWLPLWSELDEYGMPEGQTASALWQLPLVSADPAQPSLTMLETKLRTTLDLIKEVREEKSKAASKRH